MKDMKSVQKLLAKRSYAMWDILMATEEEARQLAGSIIKAKAVRLRTNYMGTRKIRVTLHGCLQISHRTGWGLFLRNIETLRMSVR